MFKPLELANEGTPCTSIGGGSGTLLPVARACGPQSEGLRLQQVTAYPIPATAARKSS